MDSQYLSIRKVAAACGVSLSTVRRRREAGDLPGAVKDPAAGWLIPVQDLPAAGLHLQPPAPSRTGVGRRETAAAAGEAGAGDEDKDWNDLVAELRAELARQRHQLEVSEAVSAGLRKRLEDREAHLADLRMMVFALLAGAPGTGDPKPRAVPSPSPPGGQAHDGAPTYSPG